MSVINRKVYIPLKQYTSDKKSDKWDGITMTEAMELEPNMDLNGILLFSEQDGLILERIDRIERKLERLERTMAKLGRVVLKHLAEAKEENQEDPKQE
jgi:hypothetical protein